MRQLFVSSSSACFELENSQPYEAPQPYQVLLDGTPVQQGTTNVFSLFHLRPGTTYRLTLICGTEREETVFTTRTETCALNAQALGATGDGVTDDTAALQRAILILPRGGRLILPKGTYLSGPLFLKSHMTLELQEGAVLLGLTEKSAYPVLPGVLEDAEAGARVHLGGFEGLPRDLYASLLTAESVEDLTIIGPGLADGNAQNGSWWQGFREDPVARPRLLFLNRCSGVTVHGLQAANSPSWQLHPYYSTRVAFYDVAVTAPKNSPNTDALDPESCDGVEIIGCRFSVGDDCIAIKSGKLELARELNAPAIRHTIRNCLMAFGHGAVTLGSEVSAGVRELRVSQCLFRQTDRGLRIKTRRGRGDLCVMDGIVFENIRMEGVLTPIVINAWYNCVDPDGNSDYVQGRDPLPVDDRTPRLGRFAFRHMICEDAQAAACYVDGLPESPIEAVEMTDVSVSFRPDAEPFVPAMQTYAVPRCKLGFYFENVKQVSLRDVRIVGAEGEPVVTHQVGTLELQALREG